MKNKIYNHIILCGLLSSSVVLVGMDTAPEQKMPLTPRSTSPQSQTSDKHHRPRSSSHSTTPSSTPSSPHPQAHHHHHHHEHPAPQSSSSSLIPTLVQAEEKIHSVGDAVLGDIIANPQMVTAGLTLVMGQPAAQAATTIIEEEATAVKEVIDNTDNFVQEYKKTHSQTLTNPETEHASSPKNPKNSQKQSDNNNRTFMIGGTVITLASILLLLYKYDYLPNIQQFFNKLTSSQATA